MTDSTTIAIVGIIFSGLSSVATLAVKGYIDSRLESKKARLFLGARLYDRRLDAISSLYALLREAEILFQQRVSPVVFKGERPREETFAAANKAYQEFVFEFLRKRILLPVALTTRTEAVITALSEASMRHSFATDPTFPNGESRKDDFGAAYKIIHEQVPPLLEEFENACRAILEPNNPET
jgi:hypothetical protein